MHAVSFSLVCLLILAARYVSSPTSLQSFDDQFDVLITSISIEDGCVDPATAATISKRIFTLFVLGI